MIKVVSRNGAVQFSPRIIKTSPCFPLPALWLLQAKYLKGEASNLHGNDKIVPVFIEGALEQTQNTQTLCAVLLSLPRILGGWCEIFLL